MNRDEVVSPLPLLQKPWHTLHPPKSCLILQAFAHESLPVLKQMGVPPVIIHLNGMLSILQYKPSILESFGAIIPFSENTHMDTVYAMHEHLGMTL